MKPTCRDCRQQAPFDLTPILYRNFQRRGRRCIPCAKKLGLTRTGRPAGTVRKRS